MWDGVDLMPPGPGRSKVPAHLFVVDPDYPHADHRGWRVCARCGLLGLVGDARHTLPVADQPDVRKMAAGEG